MLEGRRIGVLEDHAIVGPEIGGLDDQRVALPMARANRPATGWRFLPICGRPSSGIMRALWIISGAITTYPGLWKI